MESIKKHFTLSDKLILESGQKFGPITLAYETYGALNGDRNNAILIAHALSGDSHAAGISKTDDSVGWWNSMIGPNKAFDTNKYFIICSNVLGGCAGSTGPSSINPLNEKPYTLSFPLISIGDMVNAQICLIDHLKIDKLLSVVGGSMGGMQVLEWFRKYPNRIHSAIPVATTMKHSPQQIAFNEVARQAIMTDPNWNNGDYYQNSSPLKGLAVARMIGHITYMSDKSMAKKFGRQKKIAKKDAKFTADFEVEGYLHYRGDSFVKRFDANSFLYITKAMDNFDLIATDATAEAFTGTQPKVLVISFKSDWLYPTYQSKEMVKTCKLTGVSVTYCEIDSTYGHDAFLLEISEQTHLISHFLKNVYKKIDKPL
ncbi:MAG: homoserine O-acetyltransferase [Candidatus Omnitrophica bacterium]|nr:homoserine O-acetyltransferase [Candidatus Omnitrophota bacterium]